MVANEAEWSLPLSEELPEGLSDESPGRVTREDSSEATSSTSGARPSGWVDRSWKAMSYFSRVTQDDIDRMRRRYQIPDDVVLRIPDSDERACCPKYVGDVAFYEADLKAGLRFPIQPFVRELLDFLGLAPGQINPNGWRTIITCMVMWRVTSNGSEDLTVDELFFSKSLAKSHSPGAFGRLRTGMPTLGSFRGYRRLIGFGKTSTFLSAVTTGRDSHKKILGTLLESVGRGGPPYRLVCVFSSLLPLFYYYFLSSLPDFFLFVVCVVLDRPLLNSVWQQRILKILDIEDRRYNIFIEPDLLTSFSLGPVPNSTVKALARANKKRELSSRPYSFFFFWHYLTSFVHRGEHDEAK
jgi:hypothetical protein